MDEIVQQARGIELLALENHAHLVIVPVQVFALSVVLAQVVRGGKCFVNADFVHGPSFESGRKRFSSYSTWFSMKRATSERSCVVLYSGRDSIKILPYCMRWMRLSRMDRMPRSVFDRMSRPKPCFSAKTASGT